MLCFWVQRARFGEELLEVVLLVSFPTTLSSIHHCNGVIWLALLVRIMLVLVGARVAVALLIVVIVTRKAVALLFFLIGPLQHHVAKGHDRAGSIPFEVTIELLSGEPLWKQSMMSSLAMLAMVERVSKNLLMYDLKVSPHSYLHKRKSW